MNDGKVVEYWKQHWNAKASINNLIELNGYCVNGVPIDADLYHKAVIHANIELLSINPNHHVLEVGCGSGLHLYEMEKITNHVVGVDLSEELLKRYTGKATTYVASATNLPFEEDEQFDRILMNSVAHYFPHFNYFQEVVHLLLKLLKVDGILLIGDMLNTKPNEKSSYQYFPKYDIINFLETTGYRYSISSQNKLKRTINNRFDIIIYKD
jgi:ubiquinone/menaquinone biosynthesis C-methylase UbiE